jgi:hypothetical protein
MALSDTCSGASDALTPVIDRLRKDIEHYGREALYTEATLGRLRRAAEHIEFAMEWLEELLAGLDTPPED